MLHRIIFTLDDLHRLYTDIQMLSYKILGNNFIRGRRLYPVRYHRSVRDQEQCPRGYAIREPDREYRGCFHVNSQSTCFNKILFKMLVKLPYPTVRRVNNARVILLTVIRDRFRTSLLDAESR